MKDPTLWLEVANYQNQIKNSERTMILKEKHKYYELAEKEGLDMEVLLLEKFSADLEFKANSFVYNDFQAYVAAKIIRDESWITIAKIPTGTAKSFIAAIHVYHYQSKGQRVAIVTSEQFFVAQLRKMLELFERTSLC